MVARWAIGIFLGYWLVGMVGIIATDQTTRRVMYRAVGTCLLCSLWLPLYLMTRAMELIEWSSSRTKIDFDADSKDHTRHE